MPSDDKRYALNLNSIFLLIGLIAFIFTAGVNYGALMAIQDDVKNFESQFARKDVLNARLDAIDSSLKEIKEDIKLIRDSE